MAARKLNPIHPGEVLAADFLEPLGLSQYRLARDISAPPQLINEIGFVGTAEGRFVNGPNRSPLGDAAGVFDSNANARIRC